MNDQDEMAYFSARAVAERELSAKADDPAVAAIHAKLADRYERLASEPRPPRPILHIVTA